MEAEFLGSVLSLLSTGTGFGRWLREGRDPPISEGVIPANTRVLRGDDQPVHGHSHEEQAHHAPWYAALWLIGVDSFSSLGYAAGLAIMAADHVAPVATFILVLVTFFAELPVYAMVAKHSSEGEGSS